MSKDIYTEDSIESLNPRDHIRLRSGMYIGSNENPNQLLLEVFSNALDEHNIGHGDRINVYIGDDGVCSVEDYGQGFPINVMRDDGKTVLEASVSVINTSGKYRDDGVYSGSALGLNGVGLKVSNFLSEWFEITSGCGNKYEHLWFKDGIFQKRENGKWNQHSGTCITYKPDKQFFESDKTDVKYFEKFFNDIACLCPNLAIYLNNKEIKHNGIDDLITIYNGDTTELINNRFNYHINNCDICFTFTSKSNSEILAYVNYGHTESGPHITGIKSTITRILNSWARDNGLLKEKDKNLDGNSIQEGMLLACNIVSTGVTYNSQTKEKIVKMDTSFLTEFGIQLEVWLDNNPDDAKAIIEKALIARKASEAAKKAREAVKNKSNKKIKFAAMPSKLADCHNKDRSKCEIYLTEGDSASGGAKIIRDASFQAVMGLKGKILNALTGSAKQIAQNAEIMDILKALGFDYNITAEKVEVDYNPKKLRYGKFIIAADRDPDGDHIQTLILTLLWELIPQMIIDGYVYIAQPPLYKAEWGTKYKYLEDKKALNKFAESHSNFTLSYYKGLGEASPEELGAMIMNPKTRNIQQVSVEDINLTSETIKALMGSDSKPKKAFVFGNEIKDIL